MNLGPHCSYFFAPEYATTLRGEAWWRMRERVYTAAWHLWAPARWLRLPFVSREKPRFYINETRIQMPPSCRRAVVFICMPGKDPLPELLQEFRINGAKVIVDIVANVLDLQHPDDRSPAAKAAGDTVPQESWDWWYSAEPQRVLRQSLEQASVITTSFAEYVPGLRRLTDYQVPVIHVPDLTDESGSFRDFHNNMKAVFKEAGYGL